MKSATFFSLAVFLAISLTPNPGQTQAYMPESWVWANKHDLNFFRAYFPAVALNGKIYVFGGATGLTTAINKVEEYDIGADTWSVLPYTLPQPLCGMAAVELDGAIYIIGGADNYLGTPLSKVYRFHPDTGFDPDSSVANLPAPRMFHSACVAPDGKIYVIGGIDPTNEFFNTVFIYDPLKNAWTTGDTLKIKRGTHTAVVVDNKIYVIGGTQTFSNALNSVELYDFDNPGLGWVIAPQALTQARMLHGSAVALYNKIISLGGLSTSTTAETSAEAFDPAASDHWDHFCDLPFDRRAFGCVSIGDDIFIIGGNSGNSGTTSTQVLKLISAANEPGPLENPVALLPNTPNPFSQGTELSFTVMKPADIKIAVFDVTGHRIATPVSGRYGAGEYHVAFDGAGLEAGIYFCVLNSNSLSPVVQKWVVMRK